MAGSILVVEDEVSARELLAANLQRAGYKVMCAGDVPAAEALVRDSRPDLVLLDWVLPGIPGLTFARRLRNDQRTKDISIVLLTARADTSSSTTSIEPAMASPVCEGGAIVGGSRRKDYRRTLISQSRHIGSRVADHRHAVEPIQSRRLVQQQVDHAKEHAVRR